MSRILIVEDELSVAEGMSMILSDAGHQIVGIADDGPSALWMANTGTPDLVLMDIQLANNDDGVEVARRVVQAQHRVSIIFVSAHLDYRTRERAAVVDGAAFLVKPYSPQKLLEAVAAGLDNTICTEPQNRAEPPLEKANTEVVEIRHRLSNCYQVLANLVELRLNQVSDRTSRKHLIWVRETVQALAALQQQLAHIDGRSFSTYLTEAASLWKRLGTERGIKVVEEVESLHLRPDQTLPLALIANELLTNCFEHAFPDGSGTIRLKLIRIDQNDCELSVEDDGVGLSAHHSIQSSSLGLALVAALADQLGGKLHFRAERGTVAWIRFPLVPPA
jgi:two-component sensor histidine kinase